MYDIPNQGPLWFLRKSYLPYIRTLDPEKDHCQIVYITTGLEFPWDMVRALEVALLRTFASRSISEVLQRSGQFEKYGQKRYDDTALLIAEFMQWGYDHPRGKAAIERMNFIHSHFQIKNEDYLFVLSTFVLDPIKWMQQFGWRALDPIEEQALFRFFVEIGRRMQLHDLPESLDQMRARAAAYEAEHFAFAPENKRIADATIAVMEAWFPPFLRPPVRPAVAALLDEALLEAFGMKKPAAAWRPVLEAGLRLRAQALRVINPHAKPSFVTDLPNRTYPDGYQIEELGPKGIRKSSKP